MSIAGGVVDVRTFGAAGTGAVSDSAAFQRAFDFMSAKNYSRMELSNGTYLIDSSLRLPGASVDSGQPARFVINGNGAEIIVSGSNVGFNRDYTDVSEYTDRVWVPTFRDINFTGSSAGIAIKHWGSASLSIESCSFNGFGTAVHIGDAICPQIKSCSFLDCTNSLVATELTGQAASATADNSLVSMLSVSNCRVTCSDISAVGFSLVGCRSARLESCIVGGSNCNKAFSAVEGSGSEVSARLTDCWADSFTSIQGSAIELSGSVAMFVIDGFRVPAYNHVTIDASGLARSVVRVENCAGLDLGSFTDGAANNHWIFDGNILSTTHFSDSGMWNGDVPLLISERTLNHV